MGAAVQARAQALPALADTGLRGAIDATEHGLRPDAADNQSKAMNRLIREAAARNLPVFLPPGDYILSDIDLPDNARITGVAGASRLVYGGSGPMLAGNGAQRITLSGIVVDGGNRRLDGDVRGLVNMTGIAELTIENCTISGAAGFAVNAERCGGRIDGNRISGAGLSGVYAVESTGLSISDNTVFDCGNGGILVHRWEKGEDGTVVARNRIFRIGATQGGTGENGNGINVFRADGVMISANRISDCAFSAIRSNAGSNVQIAGNQCLRSGETAIYSEFGFEGALVSGNLVDEAANGILIVNFDTGGRLASVSNNIVRNLRLKGPYVHDGAGFGFGIAVEADTAVSGNVIENAPRFGMMLGWGPYMRGIVATGNLVRACPVGCAVTVVEGAGSGLIADNLFQDTPDGAVVGYRWNDKATGDLCLKGAESFAHLSIAGNRAG